MQGFKKDIRKNNTTHYGSLYFKYMNLPFASPKYRSRVLRIWVPENFDINKSYGVLYMSDGQNAVDENLTAYGEWNMEDHFHNLTLEGYPEFIIVGFDCPKNGKERVKEYLPLCPNEEFHPFMKKHYGDEYATFMAEKIVPLINSKFNINQDLVGFCGSSMGGLISYYICTKYPEIFKFCISFSPAFFFYSKDYIERLFHQDDFIKACDKYVFFVGGNDPLERKIIPHTELMYNLLKESGYNDNNLLLMEDFSRIHHESTWSDFIEDALRFCLKEYKK